MRQPEFEAMEREELGLLQLERLQSTLTRAYRQVKFYRQQFDREGLGLEAIRSLSDLARLSQLRAEGMTILLVEQNARVALKVADRAYVLETGRIILSGTAADLLQDRQVTRAYLGRDYKDFTEGR